MRRREFITLLGGTAALWPRAGAAQQPIARIGFLGVPPPSNRQMAPIWEAFIEALQQKGWLEGRNIVFDRRWSEGRPESYPELAAKLIATRPDLIIALSSQATQAAHQQTDRIPIVAVGNADLVALGLIVSLARPGGNLTGFSVEAEPIEGKLLQILQQVRPGLSRIALLYTPANPGSKLVAEKEIAFAPRMGVAVEPVAVNEPEELGAAFATVAQSRPDAISVHATPVLFAHAREIAIFAIDQRLPTICGFDGMTRDGLMLSYSPDYRHMWGRAAAVADQILKGAKPADIPVEMPTRFNLVVNLKTAHSIGLDIPPPLLARADEVIE